MRAHVPFLDVYAMEWTPGYRPGLYSKLLSSDPSTGARTALQCIDLDRGYIVPTDAHFHNMDEEIFVVKGCFSFDSQTYLKPGGYCYHPSRTVHGFRSDLKEESWFISRVNTELDFNYEAEPKQLSPYSLDGVDPERPVSVVAEPAAREWEEVRDESGKLVMRRLVLSQHPRTGEGAMLVELAPGWTSPHGDHTHKVYVEAFVTKGELLTEDGRVWTEGCYAFKPPGTVHSRASSQKGATLYVCIGGHLDYTPANVAALASAL